MVSDGTTYLQSLNDTIADEAPALIKAEIAQINELLVPLNLSKEASDTMVVEMVGDASSSLIKEREELKTNYLELKANKGGANVSALRKKKEKKLRDTAL